MKKLYLLLVLTFIARLAQGQNFFRSELPTTVSVPWEISYGPDGYLWLTEKNGVVSRVHPTTGAKQMVYTATDYFPGSPLENNSRCHNPPIGAGTLGLALHPDFLSPANSYLYFVYSYNSGTAQTPATKFRIKRLQWDALKDTVVNDTNIVNSIPSGFDHWGGRLLAVKRNGNSHLFLTVGDLGISEINAPDCYSPQSSNPNNFTQDINTMNGKIHRFNMDGSIPNDNPVNGNSFYTRGHRNPQGLIYNPNADVLYDVEHGDRTDDEINILYKGMNYGWKNVRGYHGDNNHPGEATYIANYTPNPAVPGDSLVPALYSWCDTLANTNGNFNDWCTVAPSDGIYYGSSGITQWTNSLLVVTLKDGSTTDREVYRFQLLANGKIAPSTPTEPNPSRFFGADQQLNGRLRDLTFSPDGRTLYLINNGGATDKITVYELDTTDISLPDVSLDHPLSLYPNPAKNQLIIESGNRDENPSEVQLTNLQGVSQSLPLKGNTIDISWLSPGLYFVRVRYKDRWHSARFIKHP